MRHVGVVILLVVFAVSAIGLWPGGVMAQQAGKAAGPAASVAEDKVTAKWKQAVNAKLDEIVKEAEKTGNARLMELARQIRETVSKVRKIENGGNGGA